MAVHVRAMYFPAMMLVFASTTMIAADRNLSACDTRVLARHGNIISIGLNPLAKTLNDKLRAAHSEFSDLRLTSAGGNNLKVGGKKNGAPISISGPLQMAGGGQLQLHAHHIEKRGREMMGLMDLFGRNLSDYVSLKRTKSMRVRGNDLRINPDILLGLHGRATRVELRKSTIEIQFASRPCQ